MTSLSPEQNFEVIDALSVDVIDHPLRSIDSNGSNSNNNHLGLLGSPNSLDGFQSVSAPASFDPVAMNALNVADIGASMVIINPSTLPSNDRKHHAASFTVFEDSDEALLTTCEDSAMSSSLGIRDRERHGQRSVSPDPIMRPNSDWEIMTKSIIADNNNNNSPQLSNRTTPSDNETSITDKLKLFWNNARYQLKANTTGLSETQPIWLLGQSYVPKQASSEDLTVFVKAGTNRVHFNRGNGSTNIAKSHFDKFRADFRSRIWITYRKDFSPLPNSDASSDLGWGCMIRSGQMMLAQAFLVHRLARSWVYTNSGGSSYSDYDNKTETHRKIIRWFGDSANKVTSPFSIHRLTELSQECLSKRPGDWFGPSSIAVVLRKALIEAGQTDRDVARIGMYVAVDCTVFLGDVRDLIKRHDAVIIFVPVRLGMDAFDLAFSETLKAFLSCKYSLGIIGGKPKHSLYFVGYQGSNLIYLDPHFCQPTVDTESNSQHFDVRSYHCDTPQKTSFSNIDPSLALGFFFKSAEFDEFHDKLTAILRNNRQVFVLSESSFADHQHQCNQLDDAGFDHMGFHNLSLPPGSSRNRPMQPTSWFIPPLLKRTTNDHVRKSPRDDEGFIKIPKPPSSVSLCNFIPH